MKGQRGNHPARFYCKGSYTSRRNSVKLGGWRTCPCCGKQAVRNIYGTTRLMAHYPRSANPAN